MCTVHATEQLLKGQSEVLYFTGIEKLRNLTTFRLNTLGSKRFDRPDRTKR